MARMTQRMASNSTLCASQALQYIPPLTQSMDPEKKGLNFIFPTKYVIPKSLSRLACLAK